AAEARARLDDDAMAPLDERAHAGRGQRHALLAWLDLARNGDDHEATSVFSVRRKKPASRLSKPGGSSPWRPRSAKSNSAPALPPHPAPRRPPGPEGICASWWLC